jgi:hypothetical protein
MHSYVSPASMRATPGRLWQPCRPEGPTGLSLWFIRLENRFPYSLVVQDSLSRWPSLAALSTRALQIDHNRFVPVVHSTRFENRFPYSLVVQDVSLSRWKPGFDPRYGNFLPTAENLSFPLFLHFLITCTHTTHCNPPHYDRFAFI